MVEEEFGMLNEDPKDDDEYSGSHRVNDGDPPENV